MTTFPLYHQVDPAGVFPFLFATIAFLVATELLGTYLKFRQCHVLRNATPPRALVHVLQSIRAQTQHELREAAAQADGASEAAHVSAGTQQSASAQEDSGGQEGEDGAAGGGDGALPEPNANMSDEELQRYFDRSHAYARARIRLSLANAAFDLAVSAAALLIGALPWLWDATASVVGVVGLTPDHEIARSLVMVVCVAVVSMLLSLPFQLYSTFVVEERYGFNKQTLALFVQDTLKTALLSALVGLPTIAILLHIVKWGGRYFFLYAWLFLLTFSLIMITVYPVLIAPCFNKFTPLERGPLRERIEALARRLRFPLAQLYVVDSSRRSAHSNAYFYGFFRSKRIVLFDTLLKQASDTEIEAVLGHELGHWKYGHTLIAFALSQTYALAMLYTFSFAIHTPALYASFGFDPVAAPVLVGLLLFSTCMWSPVDHVATFLINAMSRRMEFQADAFAVQLSLGEELQRGLVKIMLKNLSALHPDPWYATYYYSHPPLVERLRGIQQRMQAKDAAQKKAE